MQQCHGEFILRVAGINDMQAEPFGRRYRTASGSQPRTSLAFPGQIIDIADRHYNMYRDYDPTLGRYLQADPIGLGGGDNVYGYVAGNPVTRFDWSGRAYFALRPLDGLPWLGILSDNPLDLQTNTVIAHEQLFFEDGRSPSSAGFFADSQVKSETPSSKYRRLPGSYNDCVMPMAAANVDTGKYNLATNNCQTWADKVRAEYILLMSIASVKKMCAI